MEKPKETYIEEKVKGSNEKLFKFIGFIVLILGIITISIIKFYNPDWSWSGFLITLGIILFVGIFFLLVFKLQDWWANYKKVKISLEEKLPPAITPDQARTYAQGLVMVPEYSDMIPYPKHEEIIQVGENPTSQIYHYQAIGYFTPHDKYDILVNMHQPEKRYTILLNLPDDSNFIRTKANGLAQKRDTQPNTEVTETSNPLLGTTTRTEKKNYKNLEKEGRKATSDL